MSLKNKGNKNFSVLRIVWEFPPKIGGSVTHISELARQIDPYFQSQIIFAPYIEGCEVFDKSFPIPIIRQKTPKFCDLGVPIIGNMFYSFYSMRKILQIIKENNVNIIHFHSPILASYFIPQIKIHNKHVKFFIMCHGWPGKKEQKYRVSYYFGNKLIPLFPPDKYLILDDGSQIYELQSILDKKSISWDIVYHGIDSDLFKPAEHPTSSNFFNILFPHRPISIKRPDIAIKIFKKFLSNINDYNISLQFLSASHSEELIELSRKEGIENNVQFLNELSGDELINCINNSSVVIGTSLNSNNGRAIQEAMACGKPVVVFNNNENMSNLIENMDNGILIDSGNIDDFVESLVLLYNNPDLRHQIGRNARKSIIENRSWEKRVKKELSVYQEII
jgi:glycosyltransferase involved in cell wall biosynthesis